MRFRESKKYVSGYLEIERIQKEAQRIGEAIGEKKGEKKKAVEMAKKLKEKGIDVSVISETSGLKRRDREIIIQRP